MPEVGATITVAKQVQVWAERLAQHFKNRQTNHYIGLGQPVPVQTQRQIAAERLEWHLAYNPAIDYDCEPFED